MLPNVRAISAHAPTKTSSAACATFLLAVSSYSSSSTGTFVSFAFFARAILFSTSSGVIFTKLDAKTSI